MRFLLVLAVASLLAGCTAPAKQPEESNEGGRLVGVIGAVMFNETWQRAWIVGGIDAAGYELIQEFEDSVAFRFGNGPAQVVSVAPDGRVRLEVAFENGDGELYDDADAIAEAAEPKWREVEADFNAEVARFEAALTWAHAGPVEWTPLVAG